MGREFHVRFCEGLGVQFPRATRLVVFCETEEDALAVRDRILPPWLAERGLALSPEKTRIVHLTEGFDFLSFTVRHYANPKTTKSGFKLLIKPSRKAVLGKVKELREAWLALRGRSLKAVLWQLNPIIRGWANYNRTAVASRLFNKLDNWMFRRALRYARHTHPEKSWKWVRKRY